MFACCMCVCVCACVRVAAFELVAVSCFGQMMETTQNRGNQALENNGWGRVTRKDKEDRPIKGENQERGGEQERE